MELWEYLLISSAVLLIFSWIHFTNYYFDLLSLFFWNHIFNFQELCFSLTDLSEDTNFNYLIVYVCFLHIFSRLESQPWCFFSLCLSFMLSFSLNVLWKILVICSLCKVFDRVVYFSGMCFHIASKYPLFSWQQILILIELWASVKEQGGNM